MINEKNTTVASQTAESSEANVKNQTIEKTPQKHVASLAEAERLLEKGIEIARETAAKAFDFFVQRGGEFGSELEDWFRAEKEVLRPVPVEIRETDDKVLVFAAVPGFRREEIEVSVKGDQLILNGHTEANEERAEGNLILREWSSNRIFRQLVLPAPVREDSLEVSMTDGMLELTLSKTAAREAEKAAVTSA